MPDALTDLAKPVPSIIPGDIPVLSDAIAEHDSDHLDEVARLIGRLAVAIE